MALLSQYKNRVNKDRDVNFIYNIFVTCAYRLHFVQAKIFCFNTIYLWCLILSKWSWQFILVPTINPNSNSGHDLTMQKQCSLFRTKHVRSRIGNYTTFYEVARTYKWTQRSKDFAIWLKSCKLGCICSIHFLESFSPLHFTRPTQISNQNSVTHFILENPRVTNGSNI